jgi:hypothetical protein
MEYLGEIGLYIYSYFKIPEFIKPYIYYIPDCSSPESFTKTVNPEIQHIITEYLDVEDITRIYDDTTIAKYIELFNHAIPSLRDANVRGLTHTFKYLIRNEAIVTEYEMVVAVIHGRLDNLKHIIETTGIAPQNCLLHEAVETKNVEIIEFLVGIGIRPLDDTIELAIKYGLQHVVSYLIKHKY